MPLYFAYGSNMDLAQMAKRCPASKVVGLARLPRHRFVINTDGYATIARDPRSEVHGLLYDLAFADISSLDRYEELGRLYTKISQPVIAAGGPKRALVYVGRTADPGMPKPGYLELIISAAHAAGLPPRYIGAMEAMSGKLRR